ncbi:trypsin-like serine peptidase [Bacillus sp. GZT]|uniref:trypsin-like serine peptidase n=1 Tax=Bacillus sp. GZT TaxID=936600 RepID=UPI0007A06D8A|nr:serine protease [Bacillus sp. GZT]KYZ65153.1 peptidase [Bacillus sp. GZT]
MLDSFISIRCRLALYSFGVLFIFFCTVFWVNQKVYAEDVPWTSVSNEGDRVLFQEQSMYSNDRRGEDLVSPSFEGRKHGGEDWGYLLRDSNFNYPSNILTHSIIGRDDRIRVTDTTLYPYRAIVHLVIQFNGQEVYGCTGALISKDTVFTAGHCVYNKKLGGWAKNVIVTPGRNGNQAPYLPYSWTKLYSVSGWTDDGDSEFDYGAIKLNGSPGDYTGWLGYRTTNVESPKGLLAVVPGYPCDKVGNEKYTMWTDYGPIEGTSPRMLTYRMDTYGCQSGAPVYHDYSRTGVTIIATHTVGSNSWNSGNRVTDDVFNNLKKWSE